MVSQELWSEMVSQTSYDWQSPSYKSGFAVLKQFSCCGIAKKYLVTYTLAQVWRTCGPPERLKCPAPKNSLPKLQHRVKNKLWWADIWTVSQDTSFALLTVFYPYFLQKDEVRILA